MRKPALRTAIVVLATLLAIAAPTLQYGLGWGLSASDFAGQGDKTLRAEGYAFSIWSVIYLALAIYAVWQAAPRTPESPLLRAVAWPSVVGIGGCGLWIVVTAMDWRWLSVAVIAVSTMATILSLWRVAPEDRRWVVDWPLGLLGGWLTAATALNVVTVLTMEGLVSDAAPVAIAALSAGATVALAVLARTGSLPYGLAVLWALAAVWIAERADKPAVAWVAAGWALVVVVAGFYLNRVRRT